MSLREKTLLSLAATHPRMDDISHVDLLVDFYDGEYRLNVQPYNRHTSLPSRVTVIGNRFGMNLGAKIPMDRAKRFSAKKLADLRPTSEHWRQINDIITRQGFVLPDASRETLNAEMDAAEMSDAS